MGYCFAAAFILLGLAFIVPTPVGLGMLITAIVAFIVGCILGGRQ